MAAIALNDAKYHWRRREWLPSLLSMMKCTFQERLGLHAGDMRQQLSAMMQSQLRPIRRGMPQSRAQVSQVDRTPPLQSPGKLRS